MTQIPLQFAISPDYSKSAYFVDPAVIPNPLKMLLNDTLWGDNVLLICGQPASGKTHLAHIYATHYNISVGDGAIDTNIIVPHYVIDNVDKMDEKTLFHALNHFKQANTKCLLTSTPPINHMPFKTPDVISRLQQAMLLPLKNPSDMVLQHILLKTLNDYGLFLNTEVVSYIIPRLHRSYESVQTFVKTLNQKSLSEKTNATIPFVKKILDALDSPLLDI